ncbi:MAG: PSD1 domain-containing protein [Planctomycetaceae bacterium]|nr:PSD1 domain-containing protein [Planctomycetaceae bacterium]
MLLIFASVTLTVPVWAQQSSSGQRGPADIDYSRDIRPILSDKCFRCHGPDHDTREADLRLDQKDGLFAVRDGVPVIQPGDPKAGIFVERILTSDVDLVMPPPSSNKSLSAEEKHLLQEWIRQGAPWEKHWSFVLPQKPPVPATDSLTHASWGNNEIDAFVSRSLQIVGLEPSAEADPFVLVRRVYLDLIGLPPTPEEADQWVARLTAGGAGKAGRKVNATAWSELVESLLSSPHYGERWARRWLDLARYADTNGYEKDRERSIWPYRDWVIQAINEGMPFDQFTIQQLAGDMLPNATRDQRVATGFHRNTMLNEEGGIDPLEFRFHAMTDRVATTGTAWLGLTLACCQCHTHKYDPVTHQEYYQLMAFLNNADEPSLDLPDDNFAAMWQERIRQADRLEKELPAKWPVEREIAIESSVAGIEADGGQTPEIGKDGLIVVTGANPERATYTVLLDLPEADLNRLRLESVASRKAKGPGRTAHGNFVLSEITVEVASLPGKDQKRTEESDVLDFTAWPIVKADATAQQPGFPIANAFDQNEQTGWAINEGSGVPKSAQATFVLDRGPSAALPTGPVRLKITLRQQYGSQHTIGAFRLTALRDRPVEDLERRRTDEREAAFAAWRERERPNAVHWQHLQPTAATSNLPILTIQDDDSIFASGDTAKRDDYHIDLTPLDQPITALRLEAIPDDRLPAHGPGSTYYEGTLGDFFLTEIRAACGEQSFAFANASETYEKNRFGKPSSAAMSIDGDIQTGWSVHERQGERHVAVFVFEKPVPAGTPLHIHMSFGRHFASSLGRFRFAASTAPGTPLARTWSADVAELLRRPFETLSEDEQTVLRTEFLLHAPELKSEANRIRELRRRPDVTSTLVLAERPSEHPRTTFRHHRGEYLQTREAVSSGLPESLRFGGAGPQTRLEFAEWLVSDLNPLTARVTVNRHWQAFFGTGIVKTVDDFGAQGEPPSHPELLDWLAVTFMKDDAWSVRQLHRRIVTSATYRQSAVVNPMATQIDPGNRLLSFSPRFRLDAEIIRDQLLVAAGVFSDKIGGPPVKPLQTAGITEVAFGSPKWNVSSGPDRYRRSLYTFTKRTAPFAMLSTFDAPTGESCIAQRNNSNNPLQSLTLLNDVMLMDLARQAATRFRPESDADVEQNLERLFRSVLVRPPMDDELIALQEFLSKQHAEFLVSPRAAQQFLGVEHDSKSDASSPEMPPEERQRISQLAAWAATARALFSLDETVTRE